MDSRIPYKQLVNEETDDISILPPPYSDDPGVTKSTNVVVMTQPASTPAKPPPHPSSYDYMYLSMLAFCFCWPMGCCALKWSHEASYAAGAMDYVTAKKKGRKAKNISIAALVIGAILLVINIVEMVKLIHKIDNSKKHHTL